MRFNHEHPSRRDGTTRGSTMVLTLVVLFIVAGFVLALVTVSSSGQRIAGINAKRLTARGLAEGAVELAKNWAQTQWANQDGASVIAKSVTKLEDLNDNSAWTEVDIGGYKARYAIVRIPPALSPTPTAASKANYTPDGLGWYVDGNDGVRTMHYLMAFYGRAEYTPKANEGDSRTVSAAASRVVELQVTPLFQYAVFYNSDLEIQPGPNMTLTGRVHSNRDMFLGCGNTLKLDTDYVRAVGKIYGKRKDNGTPNAGTVLVKNLANCSDASTANDFQCTLPNGTTTASKLFSKSEMSAFGISTASGFDSSFGGFDYNSNGTLTDSRDWKPWAAQAMAFYGGTVQSSDMDVPKALPPQQNLSLDEFAPMAGGNYVYSAGSYIPVAPGTGDFGKGYFNSKAGLSIKGTNAYLPDGTNVTSALVAGTITMGTMYDARENKNVPQVTIDVAKLKQSLESTSGSSAVLALKNAWNGLVYATSATTATSSAPIGVMLTNGSELPNNPLTNAATGMTVASNLPVYVKGDYNTKVNGVASPTNDPAYRKPAAIIGDAINFLSNAWNNSKTSSSGLPTASNTTFNVAVLAGNTESVSGAGVYSGGLENLPRFHENWSGKTCTIAGSFVNLWPSKIAKAKWVYGGNIYTAPNRLWDFDQNYKDFKKIPPFTPLAVHVVDVCAQQ